MKRWPQHKAWVWERAPFLRVLLPFAAGIVTYDLEWLPPINMGVIAIVCTVALAIGLLLVAFQRNTAGMRIAGIMVWHILLLICGYGLACIYDIRNDKDWMGHAPSTTSAFLVTINGLPAEKDSSWKLPVSAVLKIADGKPVRSTGLGYVYLRKDDVPMMLHAGDTIWVPARWQPVTNAGNPGEFDYATYCRRNNICLQQFCNYREVRLYSANDPEAASFTIKAHNYCIAQLNRFVTGATARGLLQAMILGDEVNLDNDLRQAYTDTGVVHVIAISGSNVMVFFMVISFAFRRAGGNRRVWIRYAIALPLVWFYVIVAGSSPSAIRAAIMFSLLAYRFMAQKDNNNLNRLLATSFILLCAQPMWLFAMGFQLSFVAVLSVITFYSPVQQLLPRLQYKLARKLWDAIAVSLAAEILTAPLVIYYFHNFPLLFLIANVLAFAFMELVLILGMFIILLAPVPALAKIAGKITQQLICWFDWLIFQLRHCNPRSFAFLQLSFPQLVLLYIVIGGTAMFLLRRQKVALFAGISACCLLLALLCVDEWNSLQQQFFVLYSSNRANHIEQIAGKHYIVLRTDSTIAGKLHYTTTPAHTMWHAWRGVDPDNNNELFLIGNKKVLILDSAISGTATFPVDYVVLNYPGIVNLKQIASVFSPATIVVGNNYSRKEQTELALQADTLHIPMHLVGRNGAFILRSAE